MKYDEIASVQGKAAVLTPTKLTKKLVEEAYPLGLFLCRRYGIEADLQANLIIGNQSYDAVIVDRTCDPPRSSFLEITQAREGEAHYLRMKAFLRNGRVNLLGQVTKSGSKKAGLKPTVENEAVPHERVLACEIDRIEAAVRRKLNKAVQPATSLLVVFDDSICFAHKFDEDVAVLLDRMAALTAPVRGFASVDLIGWSGRTLIPVHRSV